jgi:thiol-disulfide isomerase/thioredoxin
MRGLTLTVLLLLLSASVAAQSAQGAPLSLKDIQGHRLRLADYKGRVVLINFWATWCIPCRTEIPDLVKIQRQYRNQGLRIIGITYPPEKLSEVRGYVRKLQMNYPIAIGTAATKARFTASETLPMTVVIDRQGTISDVIEGIMYPDEFQQKVRPLLSNHRAITLKRSSRRKLNAIDVQRATILVNAQGYQPESVRLRNGIPAQLTFIRKVEQTCGREIVIPDYGINRPLPLDTPVIVAFKPNKSGRFKFTCGMGMFRGALVVD